MNTRHLAPITGTSQPHHASVGNSCTDPGSGEAMALPLGNRRSLTQRSPVVSDKKKGLPPLPRQQLLAPPG